MELHQIRYFLAMDRTLNFTRAAEECNVSQPALSRAIAQLEAELGGELFRRERNLTHLTAFGQTVKPDLQRCYEASQHVKAVARAFLKEGHAPLSIALGRTIEMEPLSQILSELIRAFPKIEIQINRNPPHAIGEMLKSGGAEVAISGPLDEEWDRYEARKLYEQHFALLMHDQHRLSGREEIGITELDGERLLSRPHCRLCDRILTALEQVGVRNVSRQEVSTVEDLPDLVLSRFGIGVWPVTRKLDRSLQTIRIHDMDMSRWIYVHTIAGRRLSPAAMALVTLLRTKNWPASPQAGMRCMELVN